MPVSAMSPIMLRTVFFLSFLPPDASCNRKVLLRRSRFASVVFASGVWPDLVFSRGGRRFWISVFAVDRLGLGASSTARGGAELVRRPVNEMWRCKSRMRSITGQSIACVLCPQEKWTPPAALAPAQRPLSILLLHSFTTMFGERTSDSWVPVPNTNCSGVI